MPLDPTQAELLKLRQLLGGNVRRLRVMAGKTQRALSDEVDCELNYVQKLEYGTATPSLRMLVRLALALGCPVAALLQGEQRRTARPRGRRRPNRGPRGPPVLRLQDPRGARREKAKP